MCFEQLALRAQVENGGLEFLANLHDGMITLVLGHHVVDRGEDVNRGLVRQKFATHWIEELKRLDLVAEEVDTNAVFLVGRIDLDAVTSDSKAPAFWIEVLALVLHLRESGQERASVDGRTVVEVNDSLRVFIGRPQSVQTGHTGDHDHVFAAQKIAGRGQPQTVQVRISRGILLDVDVSLRDVGFRLVVVVVTDEIRHRVFGKELSHLLEQLGGQRLVVAHDEGRFSRPLDHVGHGEGLAGSGRTQQGLIRPLLLNALAQLVDRGRLVTCRLIGTLQFEFGFLHDAFLTDLRRSVPGCFS